MFQAGKIKCPAEAPARALFLIRVNECLLSGSVSKKHYADHLVETNDVADILSVISVMIEKQHHVLVLQGKGLIRILKRNLNVLVLSSKVFSTAFKAVEEPGLYLKFATDV